MCKFEVGKKYKYRSLNDEFPAVTCVFVGLNLSVVEHTSSHRHVAIDEHNYHLYEEIIEPKTVEHKFYVTSNGKVGGGQVVSTSQTVRFTYDDDKILKVELVG